MPDSQNPNEIQQRPGGHGGVVGKKKAKTKPKGRMVDPTAIDEIKDIIGVWPDQRDMLIEYLHLIQDNQGYLSQRHLTALAQMMKLPMAEVWEVATFYDHFD